MIDFDTEITRTKEHLSALEVAKRITQASPGCTPDELEAAAQLLRGMGENGRSDSPPAQKTKRATVGKNGGFSGKTIMECAVAILAERPGEKVFYRDIATEAMRRGYLSGRKGSNAARVAASFSQTMRRESPEPDCPIKAEGGGYYSLKIKQTE